jgi:preprotein translocase subunit SecB
MEADFDGTVLGKFAETGIKYRRRTVPRSVRNAGVDRRSRHCSSPPRMLAKPEPIRLRPEPSMSVTNGGPAPQMPIPQIGVLAQYVKDFSFENPNAPRSLGPSTQQPNMGINIAVDAASLGEANFEVTLRMEGKAESQGMLLFGFELLYAGVFRVLNVPAESLQPTMLVECPRMLFPFAREIIATATRNGGFPPLLLEPVDFAELYRQRLAAAQPAASALFNPG